MYYSKRSIAQFLKGSKTLLSGVRDDDFIKQRISAFNYDDERLKECIAVYEEAVKAESVKSKEYGEQYEAKASYEKLMEEAEKVYRKHSDFLKLALWENIEKQKKLQLFSQPRSKKISDWFLHVIEFYNLVIDDEEAVNAMSGYAITKEKLEEGRQKILAAETAKIKHTKEMGEAQDATERRNAVFEKLDFAIEELLTVCTYALEDRPQLIEKLGIPVLTAGYKRRSKKDKEEQEENEAAAEDGGAEETEENLN